MMVVRPLNNQARLFHPFRDLRASMMHNRTDQTMRHTKRFKPLDPSNSKGSDDPVLKGIIFDVDGTLW